MANDNRLVNRASDLSGVIILFFIFLTYGYLASDGWYDLRLFLIAMVIQIVPGLLVLLFIFRVRNAARMTSSTDAPSLTYLPVAKRTFLWIGLIAALVIAVGLTITLTSSSPYAGFIFLIVVVIGTPAIAALGFLASWAGWGIAQGFLKTQRSI